MLVRRFLVLIGLLYPCLPVSIQRVIGLNEGTTISLVQPLGPLVAARRAVLAMFFINGFVMGSWVTHIPFVKARFGLDEGALGLLLLSVAVGSVAALLLVGGVIARVGSRMVTNVTVLALCALLPIILLGPNVPLTALVLVLFGAATGAMDVAMNAQAVAIEEGYSRPIMSTFHAWFSSGGLAGAALGSLTLAIKLAPLTHVFAVAVVLILLALFCMRFLLPSSVDKVGETSVFTLPTGPLFWLGLLCFFGLISEGSMADWSAVYLRDTLLTSGETAALGFAAFSLMMAVGRFTGDALRSKMNSVQLVQLCGVLAAVGLGFALLVGNPIAAIIGFGCVGLGLANIVPVLFSAAGRVPGVQAGAGIAAVSSAGYAGFLVGPPLIGFVAKATNLSIGLALIVAFCGLIALLTAYAMRSVRQ